MNHILEQILQQTIYGESDSDGHLMTLLGISLSLKAKNILELGVIYGDTTLPLLLSAYLNRCSLVSVDIKESAFVPPPELKKYWMFIQSEATQCLANMAKENAKFDLVLVDDWHTTSHVAEELYYLDPMTTPTSVILLHDLMYGNRQPYYNQDIVPDGEFAGQGPYGAVSNLPNKWEWATIPAFHGLTILRKKA